MMTTIVIATADRPMIVTDCLTCLRQRIPADVEVVMVDSGIEAPVDEQALQVLWPNLRVIRSPVRNAGTQRNLGVREAGRPQTRTEIRDQRSELNVGGALRAANRAQNATAPAL